MRWLVLQGADRRLGTAADGFVVEVRGEPVRRVRPDEVAEVRVFGDATITPAARRLLLGRGVDATFFTRDGRYIGRLSSRRSGAGPRRLAQLAAVLDPERRLAIARAIVTGKLRNQHTMLARIQRSAKDPEVAAAMAALRAGAARAEAVQDLDRLRGIEGFGAKTYFGVLGRGIRNPLFSFTGRNRRPPRDPVNAVLSYVYTMLMVRCESAALGAGLEVAAGFLHEAGRGAPVVSFDLAEEWRPLVDRFVLALFNRKQLSPEDFRHRDVEPALVGAPPEAAEPAEAPAREPAEDGEEAGAPEGEAAEPTGDPDLHAEAEDDEAEAPPRPGRAVYLNKVGRGIVLTAWARRLRERLYHPGRRARFTLDDLIRIQAETLARAVEEPDRPYTPFRWR